MARLLQHLGSHPLKLAHVRLRDLASSRIDQISRGRRHIQCGPPVLVDQDVVGLDVAVQLLP
jgi:hypothetical protein